MIVLTDFRAESQQVRLVDTREAKVVLEAHVNPVRLSNSNANAKQISISSPLSKKTSGANSIIDQLWRFCLEHCSYINQRLQVY